MEVQEKMTNLLLGFIQEEKQQGQVNPDLTEEALSVYFTSFRMFLAIPNSNTGTTTTLAWCKNWACC